MGWTPPPAFAPGLVIEASATNPVQLHFDSGRYRATGEAWLRLLFTNGTVAYARRVRLTGGCTIGMEPPPPDRPAAVCLVTTTAPIEILE